MVGVGFVGFVVVIECDWKGYFVILFDKVDNIEEIIRIGDIIFFDLNGFVVFECWLGVVD